MMRTRAELDHLGLCSPEPADLASFYTRALGMAGRQEGDDFILAAKDRKLIISQGEAGTLRFAAYRVPDHAALEALKLRVTSQDWTWRDAASPFLAEGSISVRDPDGNLFLFGLGRPVEAVADDPVANRCARLQHVVFGSRNAARLATFFDEVLGFIPTDEVLDEAGQVRTTFLRSSDEHHSLAVFQTSQDRLDHCCYEAGSWDLIRDWADHMAGEHIPLKWGPGRHGPGNNLFFFVHDSDGNWVEISAELEVVKPDRPVGAWPHEERTLNRWGIGLLRS